MTATENLIKKTPLNRIHHDLKARMINFNGWEMPVLYSGVIDEHHAVRESAGIFDVSHMGQIEILGNEAATLIQELIVGDISKVKDGKALYTIMCLPSGGIIDDLIVYKSSEKSYMLCVNASNIGKDYAWIQKHNEQIKAEVKNISNETGLIALQGPRSESILKKISSIDLNDFCHLTFKKDTIAGVSALIARTGYTGEDGFEIYLDNKDASFVWEKICEAGGSSLKPIGLGARDTLRLDMKYPLYGNDLSENTTPLEANLKWTVSFKKGDFIGKRALEQQQADGISKKLVGFEMVEKGIPRQHYAIFRGTKNIGEVTSGTHSPSLNKGIGMGYIESAYSEIGTDIEIEVRGKMFKAKVVKTPFYEPHLKK